MISEKREPGNSGQPPAGSDVCRPVGQDYFGPAREDEGTLAIELLDGASRQTVWRAKTHAVLGSRAETAAAIDPLVGRMLESIPKK